MSSSIRGIQDISRSIAFSTTNSSRILTLSPPIAGPSRLTPTSLVHSIQRQEYQPLSSRQYVTRPVLSSVSQSLTQSRSLHTLSPRRNAATAHAPSSKSPSPNSPNTNPNIDPNHDPNSDDPNSSSSPPQPTSAYARFKLLSRKYGWWAVGMYFVLSAFDFTLTLGLVHSVGAERIEPAFKSLIHQYRVTRYGPDGASTIEAEEHTKAEKRLEEERKLEKGMTTEEKKKHSDGGWGSRAFWAEVVLAYTIHKTALLPLRAGLTVAWTPRVVKWLASKGWIGKGGFGRAATHAQGKIRNASDRVKAKVGREGKDGL